MFADVANLEVAAVSKRLFWHPSGVRELKTSFPVVVPPPFPERPPATFWQPSGLARLPALGKRSKLQSPLAP